MVMLQNPDGSLYNQTKEEGKVYTTSVDGNKQNGKTTTVDDATKNNDLSEAVIDIGGTKIKLVYLLAGGGGLLLLAVLLSVKK